MILTSVQVWLQ